MILRGYYYGYDEESDEHVVHVARRKELGKAPLPTEVRLPRSSYRGSDPGQQLGFGDQCEVELRPGRDLCQHRPDLRGEIELSEAVDRFLETLRDGKVARLDDVTLVGPGPCLRDREQVRDLVAHERLVALQVRLVDVEIRRLPKEALERGHADGDHQLGPPLADAAAVIGAEAASRSSRAGRSNVASR